MNKLELRFHNIELHEHTADDGKMFISGYANETDKLSKPLGTTRQFVEKMARGAFQRSIDDGHDIWLYGEHDSQNMLAGTRNGSLSLREDDKGLYFEAEIIDTDIGKRFYKYVQEGLIQNMSFGFAVKDEKWQKRDDGMYERTVKDLHLSEISLVKNPAYPDSSVTAKRSIEFVTEPEIKFNQKVETKMEKEKVLKELRAQMAALEAEVKNEEMVSAGETRAVEVTKEDAELRGVEQFMKGDMQAEEVRQLSTGSQSITVPTVLSNLIVEKLVEQAAIFGRARSFKTVAGTLEVLRENNIGDASFVGENEPVSLSDFSMDKVVLEQRRAGTAIELTEQLINDSGIDIVGYATNIMTKRLARKLDEQALIGDKANKSFEGVLTADTVKYPEIVAGSVDFATATDEQLVDKILDLTLAMHPDYLDGAVLVVNRPTFNKVAKLKDANGQYHLVKDVANGKPAYRIFGHEIVIQDKMPVAASGDVAVAFVNFNAATASMTKRGASMKRVTDSNNALKGTQLLVLDIFADFKIINEQAIKFLKQV